MPLDTYQQAAIESPARILSIEAGPGTGKTRTMTERLARMLDEGADPSSILALTFTRKAAGELYRRAMRVTPDAAKITAGTIHSFYAETLARWGAVLDYETFVVIDESDMIALVQEASINTTSQHLSDREVSRVLKNPEYKPAVHQEYQRILRRNRLLDFDGLERTALELLREYEAPRDWLYRFSRVFIDEAQDLNEPQWELVNLIRESPLLERLTLVGDPYQCIYGWRGSVPTKLAEFSTTGGCEALGLGVNYRCARRIAELGEHVTGRAQETVEPGGEIAYKFLSAEWNEFETVQSAIRQLHNEGTAYSDIAILCRLNRDAIAMERELEPWYPIVRLRKPDALHQGAKCRTILAALRLMVNPHDEYSGSHLRETGREPLKGPGEPHDLEALIVELGHYYGADEEAAQILRVIGDEELRFLNLRDLLTWLSTMGGQDMDAASEDGVRIGTIHAAKGLEFDTVIVPFCMDGIIPFKFGNQPPNEEEVRVLYVALTRAKRRLLFTGHAAGNYGKERRPCPWLATWRSKNSDD